MKFLVPARRKLNELIKRDDFMAIMSICTIDGVATIYIAFQNDICTLDEYGKVKWL